jgi:hypothetical protein
MKKGIGFVWFKLLRFALLPGQWTPRFDNHGEIYMWLKLDGCESGVESPTARRSRKVTAENQQA